eukprot:1157687-Pelagomonas_calceolata.AAC.1
MCSNALAGALVQHDVQWCNAKPCDAMQFDGMECAQLGIHTHHAAINLSQELRGIVPVPPLMQPWPMPVTRPASGMLAPNVILNPASSHVPSWPMNVPPPECFTPDATLVHASHTPWSMPVTHPPPGMLAPDVILNPACSYVPSWPMNVPPPECFTPDPILAHASHTPSS